MIWNPRGSIWHRWDPHIHAPGTLLSDQFAGDWEGYLSAIEQSDPIIRALGVTDYFCIQTYKEVRRSQEKDDRLQGVFCIFPNVELRLDMKTEKLRPINIHLIFSPEDPNHEYEIERILGKLTFTYDRDYACSRSDLIALGRACDPKQTDDDGAHRAGANQFKVSFLDLVGVFRSERRWLAKNCLVAVAGSSTDGTAGLQEDASFTAFRRSVEKFTDIIFASTPKQRDFWLGRHPDFPPEKMEATYGSLKPCMHGCDAHRLEKVGVPDLDRFCWIKGDLSFETLRQAVIEPGDRVWIGPTPPAGPSDSETLERVKVNGAPWLANPELLLNPGLITIIGARGSGKTALMEFLATGANAVSPKLSDSSFLHRAGNLLGNATVDLTWRDNRTTNSPLQSSFDVFENGGARAEVCYLSQQFVERLCSSAGLGTELKTEMQRVVFEATPLGDRMQCESFDELASLSLLPSALKRQELQQSISNIGDLVLREETLREKIPSLNASMEAQKKQIENIQKELKELLPKDKEAHTAKLRELEDLCTKLESSVQSLRLRKKYMLELGADVKQTLESREPMRFQDLKRRYVGTQLSDAEWESFRMIFEGDVAPILNSAVTKLDKRIDIAIEGDREKPLDPSKAGPAALPLNQLTGLRDSVKKEVGIDAERQKKYDQFQRALSQAEVTVRRTQEDYALAKGALERKGELLARRRNEYAEVFKTFVEEETTLDSLYGPLREKLKESKGTLGKLAFTVERKVDLKEWVDKGEQLLDLRQASVFRGHGALHALAAQHLLTPWSTGGPADVAEAMEKFRQQFYEELQKALREFKNAEEKRSRIQEVAAWLFDTSHIKVQYGITYEDTPIERLSPGTRGIVLLLMYLALDTQDRRPLFIDQPEENLDPHSVNSELVPHFRNAKQRRQVVMVTHNANLVVNTDADQVIIATSEQSGDGGLPNMSYKPGSIENPEIRESICKLLEGGRRAFIERARRYRMYWGEIPVDDGRAE